MKSVALRLEGPLQSWATQSKRGIRGTDREPSKSGVIGLVGAALGVERSDDEAVRSLGELTFAVRVDRPGSLLRDYHTSGGGTFRGDSSYSVFGIKKGQAVVSERFYLEGAIFLAALGGEEERIEEIGEALRDPRWPLFLGRRACPPSAPVFHGVHDGEPAEVLTSLPRLLPFGADEGSATPADEALRVVVECGPSEGDPRDDVPLSFRPGRRRHGRRYVKAISVDPPAARGSTQGGAR